jgi:1,4-dihydroxy-2-naphthoyl-CoA hydrolase
LWEGRGAGSRHRIARPAPGGGGLSLCSHKIRPPACRGVRMLRPDFQIEHLHQRQSGTLPGQYGLCVTELAEGRLHAQMEILPWMWAPNGYLHAASVILLADTSAGYGTFAHMPDGAKGFTTIELKTNFLGTAKEGVIRAECVAEHLGRTTHVWSSTVFAPNGRKMALFRCTQMILV